MTIQEANEKILEIAEQFQIPTIQYREDEFVTGKESGVAVFQCIPKYEVEDGRTMILRPVFICRIREMAEYSVDEMYAIAKQCKAVAGCVEELEAFFADKKISVNM